MSRFRSEDYRHVCYLWNEAEAPQAGGVEELVYRSRLLGSDQRITNTGGGNTSAKLLETDSLTGGATEVLWVKGSGGDLRTAGREHFAALYLDKLNGLRRLWDEAEIRGPKTAVEDAMVGMYPHCAFGLSTRAPSIDTPLHGFIPHRHVDHTHPNAFIAISACSRSAELTREVFGEEVIHVPWQRPGFDLGLMLSEVCRAHPEAQGINLGQHGLINWAEDGKSCYECSLELIERAARFVEDRERGEATFGGEKYGGLPADRARALTCELLPWLRGQLSGRGRLLATVHASPAMLRFVNSCDAARLAEMGTSCPDHFLRTKIKPLFVDWDPHGESPDALRRKLQEGLEAYRADYAAYYERCRRPDSPPMRDPNPTVVLIPGIGMLAWGRNKTESRVTAEFYDCAVEVMRGAEAIDCYVALPEQEAFDIEYWALEEAKLRRMPPEPEWGRRVVVVVGAGSGIGRHTARRLAGRGAHVVCADRSEAEAEAAAGEIAAAAGPLLGVGGTGLSACGNAIGRGGDVTNRAGIRALFEDACYAYGGIDHVLVTAGIFPPPSAEGCIADSAWAPVFAVNATGLYLTAKEAERIWRAQGLSGSLVATTSANAVVAKKGSLAYDASKAAANHLVRELAVELAPLARVNAVAPATVLAGSSMFPRERVLSSLAKYGIAHDPEEETEVLRDRLAGFYSERTLTKSIITLEDQAAAILFLLGDGSSRTTGHILPVDGGLTEAFLR
ncbi:MAG TPA: bifunctional rhamnulose-1-phosphate aldolase/short-chain dehydrogenase [Verrucomicrobiales bacterium]|nr:bifunctional rhamnulose-1-phosphate aldolase/short-chain dehydrogenase [Verrucomicrobiales bacterium]